MKDRVELPVVTEENPESTHISLLLIEDGLKQATINVTEQENNIKKLGEQIAQLQNMRIASIAQKNLLADLKAKIIELSK
jgi:hypothetical protein